MEQQQLYLNSDLKVWDVAAQLGTNAGYVSLCIKTGMGCSFSSFVNGYRIRHAQQLLRQDPSLKISQVCMESGFSNEQTFFRIFKATTGCTPKEWMAQVD
ncbi:MAG: AraC family transcriptional regulator [Prevotella sp.]|nr:AraC family transcriptional regulator [Prevotella sp.]